MTKITDAQVEVAHGAFLGVLNLNSNETKAMRAALEAYERVRDVERILTGHARVEQAENDARVEQALESLRLQVGKEYQR